MTTGTRASCALFRTFEGISDITGLLAESILPNRLPTMASVVGLNENVSVLMWLTFNILHVDFALHAYFAC
jgi:hypothetical protein